MRRNPLGGGSHCEELHPTGFATHAREESYMSQEPEFTSLFHYTTGAGLHGILDSNCLWATHYRHLNDAHEGETGWNFFEEKVFAPIYHELLHLGWNQDALTPEAILEIKKRVNSEDLITDFNSAKKHFAKQHMERRKKNFRIHYHGHFITSFCTHDEDTFKDGVLSQWRGYGHDGGYCIEFDKNILLSNYNEEMDNYVHIKIDGKVHYLKQEDTLDNETFKMFRTTIETEVASQLSDNTNEEDTNILKMRYEADTSILMGQITTLKHNGFKEEKEYRIACYIPKREHFKDLYKNKKHKTIHTREQNGRLIHYIKLFEDCGQLPIKRIIVGPHPEAKRRADALREILHDRTFNGNPIVVDVSAIPFTG
jgi:hypothetical protein